MILVTGKVPDKLKGGVSMTVHLNEIGPAVLATEYAVRGPIVARAGELEQQGREIIFCNIGNPQSLGQKPLTWNRQILAPVSYTHLPSPRD